MEVNDKVKELEDEVKLLKAEIRNVLLDIREVVLERKNPLGEGDSAHLTLDLNTTARAMASEAAIGEARKASEGARAEDESADDDDPLSDVTPLALDDDDPADGEQSEADGSPDGAAPSESEPESDDAPVEATMPATEAQASTPAPSAEPQVASDTSVATATKAPRMTTSDEDIPEMFMADLAPLSGDGSLAEWVTNAIDTVGVEDLRRVIVMFRLWGNVPPNISRALAHLQELLTSSDEPRPAWLKVLQDLDRLASL